MADDEEACRFYIQLLADIFANLDQVGLAGRAGAGFRFMAHVDTQQVFGQGLAASATSGFRKRNRYPLEKEFPIEYIRLYFTQDKQTAEDYYQQVRQSIVDRSIPVKELTVTRKIAKNATTLVNLGIGEIGERVSYWITKGQAYHKKTGKPNKPVPIPTKNEDYWSEHYVNAIDKIYNLIVSSDNITDKQRIELGISKEVVDRDFGGVEVNSIG